ncbi:bile acid-CoA:amino acid N-acyltransferase [Phascolarctos cinereus]|uniref:Bile acid-CoA:amino acid N-acyltransferase n=1 Tax=Phascolarctos cinereus TaxID=38626 RepID=A0A6P5LID4_PHACI|nr:bile acid-CoA:amino acid N-acyltransferase [Phascolarctos cinereus]XP_020857907.1 bile acid-CoA:amino acid N-acyltransferase [Phascolarctos cinereus]XP_020857908.1 bile acid-CoA:amino acid N-acyltransferase [Phascolarctos cinereus]XP_020857909.1 bile acid-CoA:amino acid N-acyltransferase [Phascolarctos cinereus]
MAQIIVHPKIALTDEPLSIRVTGLLPNQMVVLQAKLTSEKGEIFYSQVFYKADESGEIDLQHAAALGGDYVGVHPMGLFWSLKPKKIASRLLKQDVINSPFLVQLSVHDSNIIFHESPGSLKASETVERWYSVPGVQRIQIKEGRIRGILFLPPGEGPFPGVIDLYGHIGGLIEFRASLLASRGFATLALAYFAYEDLPKTAEVVDIEYFEEAANFLLRHPKVLGPSIGIVSISQGAQVGLAMAVFLKQVAAIVCINGFFFSVGCIKYKNENIHSLNVFLERARINDLGLLEIRSVLGNPREEANKHALLPVERVQGHILFIVGEKDCNINSKAYAEQAMEQLRRHGKSNGTLLSYPGAGHLIEPPYSPLCLASRNPSILRPVLWGGETIPHAEAQEHSWKEILKFLRCHLSPASSNKL